MIFQTVSVFQNKNRTLLTKYSTEIYNLVKLDDLTLHLLGELDGSFLTREESDFLSSGTITPARVTSLINIISSKGDEAIPAFLRALHKSEHRGHKELHDILKKELEPNDAVADSSDTEIDGISDRDGLLSDKNLANYCKLVCLLMCTVNIKIMKISIQKSSIRNAIIFMYSF